MSDITKRLRTRHDFGCRLMDAPYTHECDCSYVDRHEAADEIERLRAEVADEREQSQNFYRTMVAIEAERDRLRELLMESATAIGAWGDSTTDDLLARIDTALGVEN